MKYIFVLKTYAEALRKLKMLETKANVLTEDSENDFHGIQKKMEGEIKQKQLQEQLQNTFSTNSTEPLENINKGTFLFLFYKNTIFM